MKYLGEEKRVEIKTIFERPVEYIRCDKCGKKIIPNKFHSEESQYIHIHTYHNDWGNDSVDSHEYNDYCIKCAKEIVVDYIDKIGGSEELELTNKYLSTIETYTGRVSHSNGCELVINDTK